MTIKLKSFLCAVPPRVIIGCSLFAASVAVGVPALAQQGDGFVSRYQARVSATQAEQPHWITPLVTVTPRLEQEFRSDFVHQMAAPERGTWIYGNGKGLELIPARRMELLFNVPSFQAHNGPGIDGFGDASFVAKWRFFARNEEHGNAIVTAFLGGSIPTGKNGNGSCCAVVTPTLAGGKGFGRLSLTSTLGGSLPVTGAKTLGHTISWNNAVQYRVAKTGVGRLFWPEVEFNSSIHSGGKDDGKTATYATPGLVVGRIPLTHGSAERAGRLGLTLGVGEQIAVTHFHGYNHALLLTLRMPF